MRLMLLLLVMLLLGVNSSTCPDHCKCLWRSSKITVECAYLNLHKLPDNTDPATQILNMTGNNLGLISDRMFHSAGLLNLQRIILSNCNITRLGSHAFAGLLNLVELDLSGNLLTTVPSHIFPYSLVLTSLSLAHNPVVSVATGAFQQLTSLAKLDLSYCQIERVAEGAFDRLDNLERLELAGNKIVHVGAGKNEHGQEQPPGASTAAATAVIFPPNLHGITLHDNPWRCDCQLRHLKEWLTHSNVPRTIEPVCATPARLRGFRVGLLSLQEFACPPTVSPRSVDLTVEAGQNVTLTCRVVSEPESDIYWAFNGERIDPVQELLLPQYTQHIVHPYPPYNLNPSPGSRYVVRQQYEGRSMGYRSELTIANMSLSESGGVYQCLAVNRAGSGSSNYTLNVTKAREGVSWLLNSVGGGLQLKLEHFVVVSICVIIVLLILVIAVTLLLIHICRKYSTKPGTAAARQANTTLSSSAGGHMPKYIQMGTRTYSKAGGSGGSEQLQQQASQLSHQLHSSSSFQLAPDLLMEATGQHHHHNMYNSSSRHSHQQHLSTGSAAGNPKFEPSPTPDSGSSCAGTSMDTGSSSITTTPSGGTGPDHPSAGIATTNMSSSSSSTSSDTSATTLSSTISHQKGQGGQQSLKVSNEQQHQSRREEAAEQLNNIAVIVKDYGNIDQGQPIIGHVGSSSVSSTRNTLTRDPKSSRLSNSFSIHPAPDLEGTAHANSLQRASKEERALPWWAHSNPYIYTAASALAGGSSSHNNSLSRDRGFGIDSAPLHPYVIPLQRPVRPDEQYPRNGPFASPSSSHQAHAHGVPTSGFRPKLLGGSNSHPLSSAAESQELASISERVAPHYYDQRFTHDNYNGQLFNAYTDPLLGGQAESDPLYESISSVRPHGGGLDSLEVMHSAMDINGHSLASRFDSSRRAGGQHHLSGNIDAGGKSSSNIGHATAATTFEQFSADLMLPTSLSTTASQATALANAIAGSTAQGEATVPIYSICDKSGVQSVTGPSNSSTLQRQKAPQPVVVIGADDSAQEVLRKLSGQGMAQMNSAEAAVASDESKVIVVGPKLTDSAASRDKTESPDITRELESAFFYLTAAGETEI